jgi:hypothetical protein
MTVYAIPVEAIRASEVRRSTTCYTTTQTVAFQQTFHIVGLAGGDYYVFANWEPAVVASSSRPGVRDDRFGAAYTRAVPCGLLYTCTDHSLIAVSVQSGHVTSGIQVTDWYAPPGTFPKRPDNAPPAVTLGPEPAAFLSAQGAASYYAQLFMGGVYTQFACPPNHACVPLGPEIDGIGSAYFPANAGSNDDLLPCGVYVYRDSAGWHPVDVRCSTGVSFFPAVGASGMVSGRIGETGCVNVRLAPGRTGKVVGCLALGTLVEIDEGPSFVNDPGPSLGPPDRLWWHLKGRGWMVHTYLRNA